MPRLTTRDKILRNAHSLERQAQTLLDQAAALRELLEEDEPAVGVHLVRQSQGPLVYTTEEAADLLRIGESTVRKLMADGTLRKVMIGASVRIMREDVLDLLNRSRTGDQALQKPELV